MNEELSSPEDSQPGPGEDTFPASMAAAVDNQDTPDTSATRAQDNSNEVSSPSVESQETAVVTDTEAETGTPTASDEADEGDAVEEAPVWIPEPDKLLLSLLFASHEYLDARGLRGRGPEWDTPRLRMLVRKLNRELEASETPFEIAETEGSFRLRTLPKYFPWTRKLFKEGAPRRLSQAALETLAIVAYKQPVTKAEIESIRGVNVDGSMKTLLDKKLIDIGRRSDALGQAFTYHTTRDFMRYFGISRVPDDLPRLSEFEGILNAQTLIPQMDRDGEIREVTRSEEEPEQLTLGMNSSNESMGAEEN